MNSHTAQLTLLESTLPRASSLMELVTPSCRTKSTGLTTPDLEQGTLTTMIRTFFKRSSVGRASRKLSSSKETSAFVVKVKIVSNLEHGYLSSAKAPLGRGRRQRKRQKIYRFGLAKQQLCTCRHAFCTFLGRRCTTTTCKCQISRFVDEDGSTRQQLSYSFPEL